MVYKLTKEKTKAHTRGKSSLGLPPPPPYPITAPFVPSDDTSHLVPQFSVLGLPVPLGCKQGRFLIHFFIPQRPNLAGAQSMFVEFELEFHPGGAWKDEGAGWPRMPGANHNSGCTSSLHLTQEH